MFFKPSRFRQTNELFKSGDIIAQQAVYKADSLPCKKRAHAMREQGSGSSPPTPSTWALVIASISQQSSL